MTQEEFVQFAQQPILKTKPKRTVEIVVPTEVSEALERCQYELNARESVIDRLFEKHKDDTDSSIVESAPFKHFMSELASTKAEYEMLMDRVSKELVPEYLRDHTIQWTLDFYTHILSITVSCDCPIPEVDNDRD